MLRRIIRRLRTQVRRPASNTATATTTTTVSTTPPREPDPVVDEEEEPLVNVEMDTEQLKDWLSADEAFTLVDIREPHELRLGYAADALLLRMNDIPNRLDELPSKTTRLVIYCAAGSRSFGVAHWLREQGWDDSWSLESGFHGVIEAGMDVARPGEGLD